MELLDLARLGATEFEAVCHDLFQELLGIALEPLGASGDGGMDLRGWTAGGDLVVVQCKHRWRSRPHELVSHIERDELPKIHRMRPKRYVLAASTDLTKSAKDRLAEVLKPYGTRRSDVYGGNDLAAELRERPHIVKRHPRLWFHNGTALAAAVHKDLYERDRDLATAMRRSIGLFVPGRTFGLALRTLDQQRVLLISGLPGMGKTSLAHTVAGTYAARGYDIVAVSAGADDVDRAWGDEGQQLFLWDDFLGEPSATGRPSSPAAAMLRVLDKVAAAADKRLVLTTREYVLATAVRDHERLHRAPLDAFKVTLGWDEYDRTAREDIVRRHVAASALPHEVKAPLAGGAVSAAVARRPFFVPDSVAAALHAAERGLLPVERIAEDLPAFVGDPARLWQHIVENQLDDAAVDLLQVLYAWGGEVPRPAARAAWVALRRYAARPVDSRAFDRALDTLSGTMVEESRRPLDTEPSLRLHSGSVAEYAASYFGTRVEVLDALFGSAVHFEQVEGLWDATYVTGPVPGTVASVWDTVAAAVTRTLDAVPVDRDTHPLHRLAALADVAAALRHPGLLALLRERLARVEVTIEPYCDDDDDTALHILVASLLRRPDQFGDDLRALLLPAVLAVSEDDVERVYCLLRFVDCFPDLPAPVLDAADRRIRATVGAEIARWDAADEDRRWVVGRIASARGIDLPG